MGFLKMDSFGLTTFSRQGKLDQVDFALEAILKGETSIGICAKNGVVLASEKKISSILIDPESFNKIHLLGVSKGISYSGMSTDFSALLLKGRKRYHTFYSKFKSVIPTRRISEDLGRVMQEATHAGGIRPFGVSALVAGYDADGPHLYQIDPSGAYFGWKATSIGRNMPGMKNFLEKRYTESIELEDAIHLSILMLRENYEGEMNEFNIEIGVIGEDKKFRVLSPTEIKDYMKEAEQNLIHIIFCLLYTSDAADDTPCVDLGGRRIIKKKKKKNKKKILTEDKRSHQSKYNQETKNNDVLL
eukprot:TRINITY_DN1017_c0_g1_i7.p1 TRINITY_DN1017_c0_g1~~TRINITY_DN1017_c0_g1_i7.p1  ORF type:complete len:302 (-),score=46.92 TRINITY_DN1017_c0_g1_i7:20-925(-)